MDKNDFPLIECKNP